MDVLFLDVDGVLNWDDLRRGSPSCDVVSQEAIERIRDLCEKFDLSIIVSSTWRRYPDLMEILEKGLIKSCLRIWDTTPTDLDTCNRGRGVYISKWLENHGDVTSYIIIDDDIYDMQDHKGHCIKTDDKEGFTEAKLKEAIELYESTSCYQKCW